MNDKINIDDLVFYKTIKNDIELAMDGYELVKDKFKLTDNSKLISELLKNATPIEEAYVNNVNKMKRNIAMLNNELPKSLSLANGLCHMLDVNLVVTRKFDESIVLSVRASFYPRIEEVFQNDTEFLEEHKELKKVLAGKQKTFSVIITNRNIRNQYELLEPVNEQSTFSFEEQELDSNMSIVLDANDFHFGEVS